MGTAVDTTRIVSNKDGTTDIWRATDLEFLDFWERSTGLGALYENWRALRRHSPMPPSAEDFNPPMYRAAGCATRGWVAHRVPELFFVDIDPDTPMDFRLSVPGTPMRNRPLRNVFSPILCDALCSDLMLCQGLRQPMYQQIYQKVAGTEACYVRLMLPTLDQLSFVTRIYGICRSLYAEQELTHWNTQ